MRIRRGICILLIIFLPSLIGCGSYLKKREMQKVAKDWCLMVRASQVIPVYPLTEDVEPGDVFMVLEAKDVEVDTYSKRGFLPLDQHMTRLQGLNYQFFYKNSFGIGAFENTPHHWQFPEDSSDQKTEWRQAPLAAFPTYSFSVKSGGGINVALPVQGIPVGLSLMKTDSASGSITIADARTYGVSFDQIDDKVRQWSLSPKIRTMLRKTRAAMERRIFLRVVNRVYLTGRVMIAMSNSSSGAASARVAEGKKIEIPELKNEETAVNYKAALATLSTALTSTLPGGQIDLSWANSLSVSLSETFPRPLVIGYIGFDYPIGVHGKLGVPVPTSSRLTGKTFPSVSIGELSDAQQEYIVLLYAVNSLDEMKQKKVCDTAAEKIGGDFLTFYNEKSANQTTTPYQAFDQAEEQYRRKFKSADHVIMTLYHPLLDAWAQYH